MAFKDFSSREQGIRLLQRSLERGRLGHGYLFSGNDLDLLESVARTLAKTLNCQSPLRAKNAVAVDCCDQCLSCRKIDGAVHPDVQWVKPESKLRVITIDQIRDLLKVVNLKPTEADYKVGIIAGADRLNTQAANAFLKTLEEPPAKSILVLLTTDPSRLLETILSRCLRLNFGGEGTPKLNPQQQEWLATFAEAAAAPEKSLLGRYRLLDILLQKLSQIRESVETTLTAKSPLEKYDDLEKSLRDKWEDELTAAIEAEYRRKRMELLMLLELWLRDIWILTVRGGNKHSAAPDQGKIPELLNFPELDATRVLASRVPTARAAENLVNVERLFRLLSGNVQEALALEVNVLKLHL